MMRKMFMRLILNFLKPYPQYDVINAKLVQKEREFVHYVPTMIEKSTKQYFRKAIHFLCQFLNITKSWCLPIIVFLVLTSLTSNFEPILDWWRHHVELKLQNFERAVLRLTNDSLQSISLVLIFISLIILIHKMPIGTFLTHFWVDGVTTGSQSFKILR